MNADAEFLAAAGKVRPAGDVEVALRDFREAEQTVDGTETGAEIEGSGALFLDDHIKILAPRDERILGVGIHLGKIIEVHQALLARVHAHGVEDIAGSEGEFAADHLVLGAHVAGDIDVLEVALDAFVHIERHVEGAVWSRKGVSRRLEIDVAAHAVKILKALDIRADALGRIDAAGLDLRLLGDFIDGEHLGPVVGHLAHVINGTFRDDKSDIGFAFDSIDPRGSDDHIDVAFALV